MALRKLYPPIDPFASGYLQVDNGHTLYWEQCGNPDGVPIVFLHGGPGGRSTPSHRRFFDPDFYRIILLDQRGCGKSEPFASIKGNTPDALVSDLEALRNHLKIDKWHVFGGSWGSTLALLYAVTHPERCISMIIRGVFLMEQKEIDWFIHGIKTVFPEAHGRFQGFLPDDEQDDILNAYYQRLTHPDPNIHMPAARIWSHYEESCAMMFPEGQHGYDPALDAHNLCIARLEAHYFRHHVISEDNSILKKIDRIRHIPAVIVQGRYDMITPVVTAHCLHKHWPEADLVVVPDGGHAAGDPPIRARLLDATDNARSIH